MIAPPMTAGDTRRFLAEEIRVAANIRSPRIVEAIATVPRDRFLPPGPWIIRGAADAFGVARQTDDADPRHVHHDVSVAVDPDRQLYNGQPGLIARWFEEAGVDEGQRVLHIGTGTGYFTALIAHIVGPAGRVQGIEVDPDLARVAATNLADYPWVTIRQGSGAADLSSGNGVVIVHAGATHILDGWLDALGDGGRLLVPLTAAMGGMMANISKGFMVLVTRTGGAWSARILSTLPVAIYSLKDVRDEALGAALGRVMLAGRLTTVTRVRRDPHDAAGTCVVHGATTCLSAS